MKTWEEMSEHEQLSCVHYDAYKDCYGFRPRHIDYDTKSVEDLKADLDAMGKMIKQQEEAQAAREADCIKAFEERVQKTIESGAGDRETAIRWIRSAEEAECGDMDYLCYCLGLPYGYFTTKEAVECAKLFPAAAAQQLKVVQWVR